MTVNTLTKDSVLKEIAHYIVLILGSMIAAFALEKVLIPVQIMDGGMVGIAMIISTLTKLPLSVLTIVLNLPLVWIGGRKLERSFLIRTLAAMVSFSLAINLFGSGFFEKITLTDDKLLATVFGGLLLGLSRQVAAEYTFYLAIPTMLGASVLKLVKFGRHFSGSEAAVLIACMAVAFVVSIVVIKFLLSYIRRHDFKVFGWYRIALGALVFILVAAGIM